MSNRDTAEDLETTDAAAACRLSRREWGCDYCKVEVPSRPTLKKHLLYIHGVTRQYENDDVIRQYDEEDQNKRSTSQTQDDLTAPLQQQQSTNVVQTSELSQRDTKMDDTKATAEDKPKDGASSSASGQHLSPVQVISNSPCKGCSFEGKSLRGHLKRTSKDCLSLYSAQELHALEIHAKSIQKEQTLQQRDCK